MMFLLRTAFWLSVVLALLPTDQITTNKVNTVEAISAAGAAMSDLQQFCIRQKEACVVGQQVIETFGQRASAGARLVADQLADQFGEPGKAGDARHGKVQMNSRTAPDERVDDTLSAADKQIPFHAPAPRRADGAKRPA